MPEKNNTKEKNTNINKKRKVAKSSSKKEGKGWSLAIIVLSAALVAILAVMFVMLYSKNAEASNEAKYKKAQDYLDQGEYTRAIRLFRSLGDYQDSAEKAAEISVSLTGFEDAIFSTSNSGDLPCYSIDENGVLSFNSTKFTFTDGNAVLPDVFDNIPVKALENGIFSNCTWLTDVKIPRNVLEIPAKAFNGCSELINLTMHDRITSIGSNAFYGCSSLESIELPSSLNYIGASAFYGCSKVTSLVVPKKVKEISEAAFRDCKSLSSIIFEGKINKIGNYGFDNCTSLIEIRLDSSLTHIGYYGFSYCASLKKVVFAGSEEEWNSITVESGNELLKRIEIVFE